MCLSLTCFTAPFIPEAPPVTLEPLRQSASTCTGRLMASRALLMLQTEPLSCALRGHSEIQPQIIFSTSARLNK